MKCDQCQELFSPYHDEETTQDERRTIEEHLLSCGHCSREWEDFRATVILLHDLPRATVSPGFLAGIHKKIERQPLPGRLWGRLRGLLTGSPFSTAAFASLAVTLICVSLIRIVPPNGQQETSPGPVTIAGNDTAGVATDHRDFYPGVPNLADYEEGHPVSRQVLAMADNPVLRKSPTLVDLVSTGNHLHPFRAAGTPSPPSPFAQGTVPQPDLRITLHGDNPAQQVEVIRQIMLSRLWQVDIRNQGTVLLTVPATHFDHLRAICRQGQSSFSPDYARDSHYISPKRTLTVAVTLD